MATCGTSNGYTEGCRCEPCRAAKHVVQQAYLARKKAATLNQDPKRAKPGPKPRPRFDTNLTNLRHAVTIEEWREREAADPNCRPITQPPIRLRCEALAEVHPTPSLIDGYVDGAT